MIERLAFGIAAALSFAAGNFIYQSFTEKRWDVAWERTWFQTAACFFCAFTYPR